MRRTVCGTNSLGTNNPGTSLPRTNSKPIIVVNYLRRRSAVGIFPFVLDQTFPGLPTFLPYLQNLCDALRHRCQSQVFGRTFSSFLTICHSSRKFRCLKLRKTRIN